MGPTPVPPESDYCLVADPDPDQLGELTKCQNFYELVYFSVNLTRAERIIQVSWP